MAIEESQAAPAGTAVTVRGTDPTREAASPSSPRAQRTRAQLLKAARVVFERDGYLLARVADIAAEAGVAHGSFYNYFTSKNDVFRAVMQSALDNIYSSGTTPMVDKRLSQRERIDLANRQFIEVYRQNTALMALFEQAATIDDELRALRLAIRQRAISRVQRSIERLQQEGCARADLDPATAAAALVGMVNFTVYFWLVMGEEYDESTLVCTLNDLWASALGLAEK